ncbi:MAG: transglycosylase domain-containing protein, partial [Acidimicrobiia bacterium]
MASPIHHSERRDRRGRWFAAFAMLLSIAVLSASWLGLFSFMTANAAAGTWQTLDEAFIPEVDASELVLPDLSRVSRIYSSNGTLLATLHDGRVSEPVPFDEVPLAVTYSILAAEDEDFFTHDGVDLEAIMSAALDNVVYGTQRGGSTITQQVVKQNFVGSEISYKRKVKEALTAIELERRYPKEKILEFYMNSVYFGYGAYGVKAAADEYFGKELDELTVAEAATLAMLLRSPGSYDPRANVELALERRNDVITNMAEEGFITPAVAEQALAEDLGVIEHQVEVPLAEHVVAEVRRRLLDVDDPTFDVLGETSEERKIALFGCPADDNECSGGGGLEIHTTIDLELQEQATDLLRSWLPTPEAADVTAPTGAIAMVDNWTGA